MLPKYNPALTPRCNTLVVRCSIALLENNKPTKGVTFSDHGIVEDSNNFSLSVIPIG